MELLRRFPQFETTDLDEMRQLAAASLHYCRMEMPARVPYRVEMRTAQVDLVRVSAIYTRAPLVTITEPDPRFYLLVERQGGCEHRLRGRSQRIAPGQLFLYPPEGLVHRSFGEDRVVVARIPADLIAREARLAAAQPGPLFEVPGSIPPASAVAKRLGRLLRHLNRAWPPMPAGRQLVSDLITVLVRTTASNWEPLLAHGPCGCDRRTVRRAEEFMEARLGEPFTMGEVAAASEVSLRALEHAFQCLRGRTPVEMRRTLRLDEALRGFKRGQYTSAAAAAYALGFTNADRFARFYEHQFHEPPSAILRRVRGQV